MRIHPSDGGFDLQTFPDLVHSSCSDNQFSPISFDYPHAVVSLVLKSRGLEFVSAQSNHFLLIKRNPWITIYTEDPVLYNMSWSGCAEDLR